MGLPHREWTLTAKGLARWLAPRKFSGAGSPFGLEFAQALNQSPPALVIGCGRIAALATRLARDAGARAVQILDPRIAPRHWDLVIAPEHDGLHGDNVVTLLGSLNPVDADWLKKARDDFPQLGHGPGPRTAVLLGGPTRATGFDRSALEVLLSKLEFWLARDGGSLLVCGSRRTPRDWAGLMRERYGEDGHVVWMDDGDGRNPYAGMLGWADRIVVSPDSVNMLSEACATAVPVYIAEPDRATGRVGNFVRALLARGRVHAQTRDSEPFPAIALDETRRVAGLVRDRLSLR
jgi:mitochondrial fission protein ELM1